MFVLLLCQDFFFKYLACAFSPSLCDWRRLTSSVEVEPEMEVARAPLVMMNRRHLLGLTERSGSHGTKNRREQRSVLSTRVCPRTCSPAPACLYFWILTESLGFHAALLLSPAAASARPVQHGDALRESVRSGGVSPRRCSDERLVTRTGPYLNGGADGEGRRGPGWTPPRPVTPRTWFRPRLSAIPCTESKMPTYHPRSLSLNSSSPLRLGSLQLIAVL